MIPFKDDSRRYTRYFSTDYKKKDAQIDPLHHWIGTYNGNVGLKLAEIFQGFIERISVKEPEEGYERRK